MKKTNLFPVILIAALLLVSCSTPLESLQSEAAKILRDASERLAPQVTTAVEVQPPVQKIVTLKPVPTATPGAPVVALPAESSGLLNAYEGALSEIYQSVNPSVVSIRVLTTMGRSIFPQEGFPQIPGFPFNFGPNPSDPEGGNQAPQNQPYQEGQGSGFVWDTQGHIVTNNHVVEGASKIEVTFWDGATIEAELVGADADSDLAVIKVDLPADKLKPVQLADISKVSVGQLAIAIGNPFGLENSMTIGIISAIGRTMPARERTLGSPSYSIPDIIQTDAPINPGNSGGVLVNDLGQVVGVTYMIESPSRANAGIGFAIPASIVGRVVPSLIGNGSYQHTYLGISGMSLTPKYAKAMNLDPLQRGVLVGDLTSGGPAEKAGLQGSKKMIAVDGQQIAIGGDVITAIDGTMINGMDDLISYLASSTSVGDEVQLSILRDGKETQIKVTLEARPSANKSAETPVEQPRQASNRPWMGITAGSLTPAIAKTMGLPEDQTGVLIEQVVNSSPAEEAGLIGSSQAATINGQPVIIGGDVIIAINNTKVKSMEDLGSILQNYKAGDVITLTILREGKEYKLDLTLGDRSANQ